MKESQSLQWVLDFSERSGDAGKLLYLKLHAIKGTMNFSLYQFLYILYCLVSGKAFLISLIWVSPPACDPDVSLSISVLIPKMHQTTVTTENKAVITIIPQQSA